MTLDDDEARELARRMACAHIMRIDEMPRIELYLDQVLALVSQSLSFMALPGEELLTGSMVNNYVKQRVVPAPQRRRYTRRHVAALIFVCSFKRVFSISQIRDLYQVCVDRGVTVPLSTPTVELTDAEGTPVAPDLARVMEAGVEAVADKVFVEQTLLLGR